MLTPIQPTEAKKQGLQQLTIGYTAHEADMLARAINALELGQKVWQFRDLKYKVKPIKWALVHSKETPGAIEIWRDRVV